MSGALETAAGAFAIVGVVDVVVRTGRELYRFLSDVSDAPDEVKRLNECIRDTILLVDALRNNAQANVDAGIVASVQAAVRALDRELQSLKLVLAKFKGAKTAWSRIKYALDGQKVAKTLINMERSKSLLVNSLTIIYGELSALNFQNTSTLITQVGTKVDALQTLTSSLNTHCQVIKAKLDMQGQHSLDRQDAHQQALQSQLDDHHQQHQRRISVLELNQADFSSRQQHLFHTSKQTEERTVLLEGKVQRASHSSIKNHQKTRVLLRDGFETLQTALNKNLVCAKRSGNKVYFRGERVDMIMSYLLPIKDELDIVINQVLAQCHHRVPIQEILFLREELQKLLGSAAQEEAARYPMSTATSFDEWHFPGLDSGFGTSAVERQGGHAQKNGEMVGSESVVYKPRQVRKRAKPKMQTLSFRTNSGKLQLFISQRKPTGYDTRNRYDLGLSFTSRAQSLTIVDIRFTQSFLQQTRPRIHAHLNVFTSVPDSQNDTYWQLFQKNPTLEDIDHAIRQGSISPYHLNYGGDNYILYLAAENGRIDLLRHLESNGLGITGLRQDNSILEGLKQAFGTYGRGLYLGDNVLSTFEYIQDLVYDSSAILADLIMDFIHEYYGKNSWSSKQSLILEGCLVKLHKEGYDCAKYRLGDISTTDEFRWDRQTLCELMSLLVEAGANILRKDVSGQSYISVLRSYDVEERMYWAFEDLLYAYVQAGADVHELDDMRWTCSMAARYFDVWPLWCQALQDSGKDIEEVLRAEGNEWLSADDWENIFFEQTRDREYNEYYSEDYDESDSDVETSDEDGENAGRSEDKIETECDDGESDVEDRDEEDNEDGDSEDEGSDNENSDEEQSNDHNSGSSKINVAKGVRMSPV